jgi:hypothetical protein
MGYRSDVVIGMSFPHKDAVVAFLSYVKLGGKLSPEDLGHYRITEVTDDMIVLHARFEGVKWYESYPDVGCHHELLGMAATSGSGTVFIRIGEEYNDITYEIDGGANDHDMWDFFGIRREIVVDVDEGASVAEYMGGV